MASSSWCLSAAAAAALQNITKQATTLTGAQWGQSILEGAYNQTLIFSSQPYKLSITVFTEQNLKQKDLLKLLG